ncbi:MAG: archaetidylserine decarboxylase [Myxococcota bacterium]|nr:archaetidylserine decarboxylase [Myxococcota bacterium]
MKDGLIIAGLSVLPRRMTSWAMGWFARRRLPGLFRRAFLRWYVAHYGVNLAEAAQPLDAYPTVVSFFTRALKEGARPTDGEPDSLVAPADARVYALGTVRDGRLPQAESMDYAVRDLLDGDERFDGGEFAVLYLAPKDYHRVHAAREGEVLSYRYRRGRLWPVFPAATRRIRDLFARNERLIIEQRSPGLGEFTCVMVGAFGVGRMKAVFTDLTTNSSARSGDHTLNPAFAVQRGAELGRFEMGSTVILLLPPGSVRWQVEDGDQVRVGQRIAAVL